MIRFFFLFLLVGMLAAGRAGAQVQLADTIIHFDTLYDGQVIGKSVLLHNTGKRAIKITKVETSCGCLVASAPPEAIPPGKKDSVELLFNSRHKLGLQQKTVTIYADDGSMQLVQLRGFVKPALLNYEIDPKTQKMAEGKSTYTFDLANVGDHPLYIDELQADTAYMQVSADKTSLQPQEHATITVQITNAISGVTGSKMDYFEIGCAISDHLHLTRSYITWTITD